DGHDFVFGDHVVGHFKELPSFLGLLALSGSYVRALRALLGCSLARLFHSSASLRCRRDTSGQRVGLASIVRRRALRALLGSSLARLLIPRPPCAVGVIRPDNESASRQSFGDVRFAPCSALASHASSFHFE